MVKNRFSVEEYLEKEQLNDYRSEFYFGEIFAMTGTSDTHNLIVGNTRMAVQNQLRGKGCRVFAENVKLELLRNEYFIYPDLMVTCDQLDEQSSYIKRFPELLAEVLSPATESNDRGKKLRYALNLPSLKYFLLISQDEPLVEVYQRSGVSALYTAYNLLESEIPLPDMGISLKMTDIYEEITFPPAEVLSLETKNTDLPTEG